MEYTPDSKMTPELSDPWTNSIEEHLQQTVLKAGMKRSEHGLYAAKNRTYDACFRLPSLLFPCVFGAMVPAISDHELSVVLSGVGFLLTGVCTITNNYFQFERSSVLHMNSANRYEEVINEIECELVKRKEFRQNADVFCTYIRLKLNHLAMSSPE